MKTHQSLLIVLVLTSLLLVMCSKNEEIIKTGLLITLKDETGNSVKGATVRLYKNINDTGITQLSDTTGVVYYPDLEPVIYYWLAEKGCKNNRNSQLTLNHALISGSVLYGYSILSETGILKITNNSTEPYKVSDSLLNVTVVFKDTLNKDVIYIAYPKVGSHIIHSEKLSTPGTGKDTLLVIACGVTRVLNLPY